MSGRALKPALSLCPSSARHNRHSSQSRSPLPSPLRNEFTPSPSASRAEEPQCYFSLPSASQDIDSTKTASLASATSQSPKFFPRSRPIAIERNGATESSPAALSARGELNGGYFPNRHVNRSYTPHTLDSNTIAKTLSHRVSKPPHSTRYNSGASSPPHSYYIEHTEHIEHPDNTPFFSAKDHPRQHRPGVETLNSFFGSYTTQRQSVVNEFYGPSPTSESKKRQDSFQFKSRPPLRPPPNTLAHIPTMGVAQGKYHPSHYKAPSTPSKSVTSPPGKTSTSRISSSHLSSGSPLSSPSILPSSNTYGSSNTVQSPRIQNPGYSVQNPQHASAAAPGDIQRKLLQYQQDMREQAATAARLNLPVRLPRSPKLMPLGSPGPVTPWELDGEGGGFPGLNMGVQRQGVSSR